MGVSARYACPCMKHVAGFADCPGTYIVYALDRLQSEMSGVNVSEQMRIRAVSIVKLPVRVKRRASLSFRTHPPSMRILLLPELEIPG